MIDLEKSGNTCRFRKLLPTRPHYMRPRQNLCKNLQKALQVSSCWPMGLSWKTGPATALRCGPPTAKAGGRPALIKRLTVGSCSVPGLILPEKTAWTGTSIQESGHITLLHLLTSDDPYTKECLLDFRLVRQLRTCLRRANVHETDLYKRA